MRFLDNFSAGTRGASSAEQFLDLGYVVLFMCRTFSLRPYSRHFLPDCEGSVLDSFEMSANGTISSKVLL